jgi:hypothetical protein
MFIFIVVAGLVGMQLFAVSFHNACIDSATNELSDRNMPRPTEWSCGGARKCPLGHACERVQNLDNARFAGFDNLFLAFLTAFQVCYFKAA